MARMRSVSNRPQWYAYYITVPLAVITATLLVPLAKGHSVVAAEVPQALLFLVLMVAAQAIVLLFEVRRHSVSVTIGEIPLLLALFHLSPLTVIIIRAVACAVVQVVQRQSLIK